MFLFFLGIRFNGKICRLIKEFVICLIRFFVIGYKYIVVSVEEIFIFILFIFCF